MQKALFALLAGAMAGLPLAAQTPVDPFGPAVFFVDPNTGQVGTTAQQWPELGNLNFNTTDVAQLCLIPNPGSGPAYLGMATVTKTNATDYDFMSFTWNGPGSLPTITTDADNLNGPADEFQGSISWDGLSFCGDTGAGHPVGNGAAIVASRSALGTQFGNMAPIMGVPGGYIDPQLGRINGQDVIFYVAANNGIEVGDIDLDPNSSNYGWVTNVRQAVAPQGSIPGFQFCHSPTPTYDSTGDAVGLIFSVYALNSGSDGFYSSATDETLFPAAIAVNGMGPYQFYDDGGDWNANPASLKGSHFYADASGGYGDPLRIESMICSSSSIPSSGGTVKNVVMLPLSMANDNVVVAVNYGLVPLPNPIDLNTLGIPSYGLLCIAPVFSMAGLQVTNSEATASFPLTGLLPANAVLYVEAVALNLTTGTAFQSNVAFLEIR